ncbi:MAG: RDD family protein [Thermoanaerobaculia bacterium]
MMRRGDKPTEPEEPLLFDLPLGPGAEPDEMEEPPLRGRREARRAPEPVPEPPAPRRKGLTPVPAPPAPEPDFEAEPDPEPASEFAGRGTRLASGLADLVIHAAIAVIALLGCRSLGVRPDLKALPAGVAFLLSFSFLYTVLPLAFWGHTPGMAWARITSRNRDGEPLAFDQTVRRWLGGLLTLLLAGLPVLVSGAHRSVTDLLSGSATYPVEEEGE